MVAPFTPTSVYRAQYAEISNGSTIGTYQVLSWSREGFNQQPPYVDTAVNLVVQRTKGPTSVGSFPYVHEDAVRTEATNNARKRFVDKLGDSSSFGATLSAELRSTWGTVANGITDTLQAARAVRKGDLLGAAKILGFYPPIVTRRVTTWRKRLKGGKYRKKYQTRQYWRMPSGREVLKDLSNRWLWYSYGIKPLVSDIHNGMDVLTRPVPFQIPIKAGATAKRRDPRMTSWGLYQVFESLVSVRIRAKVSVNNPNLWLANQLGLVNPVQMFNEGIPFSFVIDWFSNLSQIIMQMTDFVGLEIAEPLTITSEKHSTTYTEMWYPKIPVQVCEKDVYRRTLDIPRAKLVFSYERFQWQRGANAISLLIGLLKKV